jgi:very-short-patch-repair endonuclease
MPTHPDPLMSIARLGGLAATHELAADGISRGRLVALLRLGRIIRVRQGWYARPGLHHELLSAARVGGILTCCSALRVADFWVVNDHRLHIAVEPNDCQLRSPRDHRRRLRSTHQVTVHWRPFSGERPSRLLLGPVAALADLAICTTPALLTASADSIVHKQPELLVQVRQLALRLDSSARAALLDVDGVCESGTETLFWLRMRQLAPQRQVAIAGVGRVDFLFGRRLIVEIDGEEFHAGSKEFESDRRRDALLSARGYRVLRFSYHQVIERWPEVHAAVLAAILRGDRS